MPPKLTLNWNEAVESPVAMAAVDESVGEDGLLLE
jgi:hypothetical protein